MKENMYINISTLGKSPPYIIFSRLLTFLLSLTRLVPPCKTIIKEQIIVEHLKVTFKIP